MSTSTAPDGPIVTTRRGRTVVAVVFALIALVFFAAGIVMGVVPGHALPHALTGGGTGHHPLRVVGSLLVGVVFAVSSWFALKYEGTTEGDPD